MITIQELLYNRGLDRAAAVKLVRHKENGFDLHGLYRSDREAFLRYQCSQRNDVFRGVDYIVSFLGEDNGLRSRFVGVYKVLDKVTGNDGLFHYSMEEVEGYEDLKERAVIRWENARQWHQWIKNKMEVIEIHAGLMYRHFTDYFDIILSYIELEDIVNNAYPDWKIVLSATKGIYLITDTNTGRLYVGSAYGEDGIWGRWCEYVRTEGTGGNKSLMELAEKDSSYPRRYFQFSILMLLPKTVTPNEATSKETLFKKKLGSNAFGLNNN